MDIARIKQLNTARHTIENTLNEEVTQEIENLVKTEGYTDTDGAKVIDIPEHLMPEATNSDDTLFYVSQVYYNPNSKFVSVIGTFEHCCPDDTDVDTYLANIDLDGKIRILDILLIP